MSRRNNASTNVIGILLYHDSSFLQYIEGEIEDVNALFDRISADPKRVGVFVLDRADIDVRALPDWTMGYEVLPEAAKAELGGFDLSRKSLEESLDPELPRSVLSMMRTFYKTTHRFSDG